MYSYWIKIQGNPINFHSSIDDEKEIEPKNYNTVPGTNNGLKDHEAVQKHVLSVSFVLQALALLWRCYENLPSNSSSAANDTSSTFWSDVGPTDFGEMMTNL